ncbi:FAD-binding oxidoreductase [Luteimonas sp. 50]|uniref:FAD-binding oxidoreductase n=1 Tax=Cognatiluteimonas sedimenti TaxID=2927791 RepID=A0ABT0A475_9GAMM|nr:FAD-dependent oxidoreductase [Lysobacter sedimenti]MCJ0825780.1 FAD-binding oxidoreductase [Lysobacter sedimenti]
MDLKSGYPWWAVRNGLLHAFPPLQRDLRCDVAVLGGGISGALIADELAAHGHEVVVIDRRDIGWGSTAASTALLQYEIDTPMTDLARRYGEADAVLAYRSCAEAIGMLRTKAAEVRDVGFARTRSLYYASKRRHAKALREEFELRKRHGFDVAWLDPGAVRGRYGFDAPGAILSRVAARMDPYRMAYRLLARLQERGIEVFDRTDIAQVSATPRGVTLTTPEGCRVRARHVVLAAGYESQQWLDQRVARNRSSYACVSDPIERGALGALATTLFWETARPYLYLRATSDGRVLVGGADDAVDIPARRDARVDGKARKLLRQVLDLFPGLPLVPAFAWAGTFAETADGLPFFGPHPQYGPRVLFAMAYGGNGITYSMLGAGLLRALVERRRHPLAALFAFSRLQR